MANEIRLYAVSENVVRYVFARAIPSPVLDFNGNPYVPTPVSSLDPACVYVFSAGEQAALDAGTAEAQTFSEVVLRDGLQSTLARARARYAIWAGTRELVYARRSELWPHQGKSFNATP